jgi:hypothetical protein
VSIQVMNLVWKNADCKGNALLALLALADWSDDDGVSFPSMERLAKKSRQSERNTQTVVRELVKAGMVEITERPGTSSLFTLNLEKLRGANNSPLKKSARGGKRVPDSRKSLPENAEMFAPNTSSYTSSDTSLHTSSPKGSEGNDSRQARIQKVIVETFNRRSPDLKSMSWSPKCAGILARELSDWPKASAEFYITCVKNRDASEKVNFRETPDMFIKTLRKYSGGPLDAYGKPLPRAAAAGDIPEIGEGKKGA